MNPIVERVARELFQMRHNGQTAKWHKWERLSEPTRHGYRQIVEEVLLAAMGAGLAIQEWHRPT